ncbi:BTB/POZ fold [Penicillium camemberti]|uniref:BTB/POZ fold n=1 Tax=Penicillium camemberti (strain FM 013) TaxID=1429867 RepID=A0A0G4NXM5_PENC3|nr:BTB/POZ fold [Penicillium camemberti]
MASTKDSSLFCEAVGGLLMEDRFSDMTIVCQEVTTKAHRAIICTQSSFFDAALKHGFKESISGTINLPDDDPETIKRVLCFLYQQTYNDQYGKPKSNPPGNSKNPTNEPEHRKTTAYSNFSVYLAADKFGIFPLKELALTKLSAWIRGYYRTPSFPKIVLEIMTSMPHDSILLGLLSDVISDYLYTLGSNNEILEFLKDHGQLGSLIISKTAKKGSVDY